MSKLFTYEDMEVNIIQKTLNPNYIISLSCRTTQKSDTYSSETEYSTKKLISYLFKANHLSVFEHAFITFQISNVSRSFLAQLTRHRMSSFTVSSQHYQKYDCYPDIFDADTLYHTNIDLEAVCDDLNDVYNGLIDYGIPKEEARQVLPNSKAVNIIWTVNARSLINFLNQRLCKRNTKEIYIFAEKVLKKCNIWWPELFALVGPDCKVRGKCTQGHMQAKECKSAKIPCS